MSIAVRVVLASDDDYPEIDLGVFNQGVVIVAVTRCLVDVSTRRVIAYQRSGDDEYWYAWKSRKSPEQQPFERVFIQGISDEDES